MRVAHAPGMPGMFSPQPWVSDPGMHQDMCVPWCRPGSLTSCFLWTRWRGKRSQHSRCMHNPQFYVSGKRPIALSATSRRILSQKDASNREINVFFVVRWRKCWTNRLCSVTHRLGYWSYLPCDWPNTACAYVEQETENGLSCTDKKLATSHHLFDRLIRTKQLAFKVFIDNSGWI